MIRRPFTFVGLALVVILYCAAPAAAESYEQTPSHAGALGISGEVTADDFSFSARTGVVQVTWWGGYGFGIPGAPPTDDFVVHIYEDVNGGPGQLLKTYAVGNGAERAATGADVVSPEYYGFPIPEYEYSFDLPEPFVAEADTTYWISVRNAPSPAWVWETSAATTRQGLAQTWGGGWFLMFDNAAFRISDTVPCGPATGLQRPARTDAMEAGGFRQVADDFVLTRSGIPTKLTWWGGYLPGAGPELEPDDFLIEFYADAGSEPGAIVASYWSRFDIIVTRKRTGCSVRQEFFEIPEHAEFRYEAILPPGLSFEPGQKYWVSIRNRPGWAWEFSDQPQTNSLRYKDAGSPWQPLPVGVAFDLTLESEPPPPGCSFPGNEQLPDRVSGNLLASSFAGPLVADDFVVPRESVLTRIEWWGGNFGSAADENFAVLLFADAGGRPGDPIAFYGPGVDTTKEATGEVLLPGSPDLEYLYRFSLPDPLPLARDTRYWVTVATAAETPSWAWKPSAETQGLGLYYAWPPPTDWYPVDGVQDAALRIVVEGNSCDVPDRDGDGRFDDEDSAPDDPTRCADTDSDLCDDCSAGRFNPAQDGPDADSDGVCNAGDPDDENDGWNDEADNCPLVFNPGQGDFDGDGVGTACDGAFPATCGAGAAQPPSREVPAYYSDPVRFGMADNFDLARDGALTRFEWYGGYISELVEPPPLVEEFTIRIYADAAGVPGVVLHTLTPGPGVSRQPTGETLSEFDFGPLFRYGFNPSTPLPLPAGRYWLSIGALTNFDGWHWSRSEAEGLPGLMITFDSPEAGPWETAFEGQNMAWTPTVVGEACANDGDADGIVDGEDGLPEDPYACADQDGDGCDDCTSGRFDPAQDGPDLDADSLCDDGDPDDDGDGFEDAVDLCPLVPSTQVDFDHDGVGDECDPDDDGDGVDDTTDNCVGLSNPSQADSDHDGIGDACDPVGHLDEDGDGVEDGVDLCPGSVLPEVAVPTAGLGEGRYALVNADGVFDTVGAYETFTTTQTYGCTCAQILAVSPGNKNGHYKHGCSGDLIRAFTASHP